MKSFKPLGSQRLSFLLEKAASREAQMWKVYVPKKPPSQDTDVSPAQRDEAVRWLTALHGRLQLYPETLVSAVSILDRFLAPIKARPKYLRCIAVTCFFLAAKTCEEDECVPSLKDVLDSSGCGCSPSEVLRMERIVLDKLNWDLHTATALDFLHIFHSMVLSCRSAWGGSMFRHPSLTRRLYHCLADHALLQLRGSMLALALITLDLESCCPDWLVLTIDLLTKAQISSCELIHSREMVSHSLSTLSRPSPPNTVYIYQPPRPPTADPSLRYHTHGTISSTDAAEEDEGNQQRSLSSSTPSTERDVPALLSPPTFPLPHLQKAKLRLKASTKRKVEEMEVDDFYDAIKRLYNEDATSSSSSAALQEGADMTAGGGARWEGSSSPCPPLQPVGAS